MTKSIRLVVAALALCALPACKPSSVPSVIDAGAITGQEVVCLIGKMSAGETFAQAAGPSECNIAAAASQVANDIWNAMAAAQAAAKKAGCAAAK